jgi:hypothetical protein
MFRLVFSRNEGVTVPSGGVVVLIVVLCHHIQGYMAQKVSLPPLLLCEILHCVSGVVEGSVRGV